MSSPRLIIIGAGGHGRVVADIARQSGYTNLAFLDDKPNDGLPVLGASDTYMDYIDDSVFFVAIGNNEIRKNILTALRLAKAEIVSLIHPHVAISSDVKIGSGTVVMAGAVINTGAVIGDGVIINTCSSVDHDCIIHNYTHVSVGSHIAGTVTIGEGTFIGAGATVINDVSICHNCTIGAGATVVKNIDAPGVYVGVPAAIKMR